MAWAMNITGDAIISGVLRVLGGIVLPSSCVADAQVSAAAAIATSKLVHQHSNDYSQPNTTATTETRVLHVVRGATGTIKSFVAGSIAANIGAATVTLDLKKNGTTVLSSVVTLNSSGSAYVPVAGTIAAASVVTGDVLTVVITATAGGGTLATGVYCNAVVDEDPVL